MQAARIEEMSFAPPPGWEESYAQWADEAHPFPPTDPEPAEPRCPECGSPDLDATDDERRRALDTDYVCRDCSHPFDVKKAA